MNKFLIILLVLFVSCGSDPTPQPTCYTHLSFDYSKHITSPNHIRSLKMIHDNQIFKNERGHWELMDPITDRLDNKIKQSIKMLDYMPSGKNYIYTETMVEVEPGSYHVLVTPIRTVTACPE